MSAVFAAHHGEFVSLVVALLIGACVGAEREYRSKAAGFRTLILICVGSALFTLLSLRIGGTVAPDRIASNIITGIGFIGAGVIFKDGVNIAGLTTATSIWVTAALGMAAGAGQFALAGIGLVLVITVLAFFERLQLVIDRLNHMRPCRIAFRSDQATLAAIEAAITACGLRTANRKFLRERGQFSVSYQLSGNEDAHARFVDYLLANELVDGFEY